MFINKEFLDLVKHGELHVKGDCTAPREPGRGAGGRTQRTWFNLPWGVCQDLACYHPLPPSQRLTETLLTFSLRNIYLFILAESGLVLFLCKIFACLFALTALGPHCGAGPSPAAEGGPSLAGAQAPH